MMVIKTDNVVSWEQSTVRRRVSWNFTRHEIVLYWRADPRGPYTEVERVSYSDDASAWAMLLEFMSPNPYVGPQDWHAI
jgi:hypothetical protein